MEKYSIITSQEGMAVDAYLKDVLKLSARERQKLFHKRKVLINGRPAFSKRPLVAGDRLEVQINNRDKEYGVVPENGFIKVLYEDRDLIIVDKPAKMLVHPAGQTVRGTLANFLAGYFQKKGQIITIRPLHRLDRDTTGCVLFAKNAKVQQKLTEAIKEGTIHRTYEALVFGEFAEKNGRIDAPIGKKTGAPNQREVKMSGQKAVTNYQVVETKELNGQKISRLSVSLETGRTHQIRVHMAYIGHPVLGDKMYGRRSSLINRQALHAKSIEFIHPATGKKILVASTDNPFNL